MIDNTPIILDELRSLRGSFDKHAADTDRRLNTLKSKMDRVLNPGPGSCSKSRSRRALPQ